MNYPNIQAWYESQELKGRGRRVETPKLDAITPEQAREHTGSTLVSILTRAHEIKATMVVFYENHVMDSSQFGRQTFLLIGGGAAIKDLESIPAWVNDLPSERQHPIGYVMVKDIDLYDLKGEGDD